MHYGPLVPQLRCMIIGRCLIIVVVLLLCRNPVDDLLLCRNLVEDPFLRGDPSFFDSSWLSLFVCAVIKLTICLCAEI